MLSYIENAKLIYDQKAEGFQGKASGGITKRHMEALGD